MGELILSRHRLYYNISYLLINIPCECKSLYQNALMKLDHEL